MATSAQERSPIRGDVHHAAVRFPPALPSDRQVMVSPVTSACPSRDEPVLRPTSETRADFA